MKRAHVSVFGLFVFLTTLPAAADCTTQQWLAGSSTTITSCGDVGIGAPPSQRLTVNGNINKSGSWILTDANWGGALEVHTAAWTAGNNNYASLFAGHGYYYNGLQTGGPSGFEAGAGQLYVAGTSTLIGSVGVGTTATQKLTVAGNINKSGSWILSDVIWGGSLEVHNSSWNGTNNDNYGGVTAGHAYFYNGLQTGGPGGNEAGPGQLYVAGASTLTGNVGVGTAPSTALVTVGAPNGTGNKLTVNGDAVFNGNVTGNNIRANYQDVAEWVPAACSMLPGTIVILNPAHNNEVMPSEEAYDTRVAGVVSANPGVLLGIGGASKAMIATTGRVKVHVDASKNAIHIGDLLVSSDKRGMAMRSMAIDVAGIKIHRPGTLIGKALEPLPAGEGEILVLLSMQ